MTVRKDTETGPVSLSDDPNTEKGSHRSGAPLAVRDVASFREQTEKLTTPHFELRPLSEADAPALLTHFGDPRVTEYMDIDPLTSLDEAREIIAWTMRLRDTCNGVRWAVTENSTFVGTCGFNSLITERGARGEVAYDLSFRHWGRGIMSEVLTSVVAFAFGPLELARVEAMVTPGNARSMRLLVRSGFEREGVLRKYAYWRGRYLDQMVYGRVNC